LPPYAFVLTPYSHCGTQRHVRIKERGIVMSFLLMMQLVGLHKTKNAQHKEKERKR
jgi:hypothetical protein